jgi:hypothetical protein
MTIAMPESWYTSARIVSPAERYKQPLPVIVVMFVGCGAYRYSKPVDTLFLVNLKWRNPIVEFELNITVEEK